MNSTASVAEMPIEAAIVEGGMGPFRSSVMPQPKRFISLRRGAESEADFFANMVDAARGYRRDKHLTVITMKDTVDELALLRMACIRHGLSLGVYPMAGEENARCERFKHVNLHHEIDLEIKVSVLVPGASTEWAAFESLYLTPTEARTARVAIAYARMLFCTGSIELHGYRDFIQRLRLSVRLAKARPRFPASAVGSREELAPQGVR